ncbi:MAG: aspartate carbamoyltransferase, partial [bacterium]
MSRNLLAIRHLEPDVIRHLVDSGKDFKDRVQAGQSVEVGRKRTVGLLFFENSTRTRVAFEQAAYYLGFKTVNFSAG